MRRRSIEFGRSRRSHPIVRSRSIVRSHRSRRSTSIASNIRSIDHVDRRRSYPIDRSRRSTSIASNIRSIDHVDRRRSYPIDRSRRSRRSIRSIVSIERVDRPRRGRRGTRGRQGDLPSRRARHYAAVRTKAVHRPPTAGRETTRRECYRRPRVRSTIDDAVVDGARGIRTRLEEPRDIQRTGANARVPPHASVTRWNPRAQTMGMMSISTLGVFQSFVTPKRTE